MWLRKVNSKLDIISATPKIFGTGELLSLGHPLLRTISKKILLAQSILTKTLWVLGCLSFLLVLPSWALAGPFGLKQGMTLDQVDETAQQIDHGVYATQKVPKPDRSFKRYSLVIGSTTGLCKVTALSKSIPTKPSGNQLITQFKKMSRKLMKKYGEGETLDFVEPGSTYEAPEQFMMSLKEKDRKLETRWIDQDGSKFKDDVGVVLLKASSTRSNKGLLTLEYEFTNFDACMAEMDHKKIASLN